MLTKESQDIKTTYGDTKDIVKSLETAKKMANSMDRYYIAEAQVHMTGLYREALLLQKQNKQLQAKLSKATAKKAVKNK